MANYLNPKQLKAHLKTITDKYMFMRNNRIQKAKIKIGLKMHDILIDFILEDGCHVGFSTGNGITDINYIFWLENVEQYMFKSMAYKDIEVIPVERTWGLGTLLYD